MKENVTLINAEIKWEIIYKEVKYLIKKIKKIPHIYSKQPKNNDNSVILHNNKVIHF